MKQENPDNQWEAWLSEYGPRLLLLARQYVPTHSDAEDAVQDAFIRFWKSGQYRSRDPQISLYSFTRRAAIDLYRSISRRKEREMKSAEIQEPCESLFGNSKDYNEYFPDIEESLMGLPEEQREVIVLKVWAGLTFYDIGRVLNVSLNTAASRYRYGIKSMQESLMFLKVETYGTQP